MERRSLRLGLLPLADAAPLVIAKARGFFARHGLDVELRVERAWASLRDKVAMGVLDAAQMLAPIPIAATLGLDGIAVPMVTALSLNLNGNAITVSHALYQRMLAHAPPQPDAAQWARALAEVLQADRKSHLPPPVFAHVFPFSTHHYELRMWLASAGIDPDTQVRLCVVPPPRMVGELAAGRVDGFCVGAPWSEVAQRRGLGVTVATKYAIWNNSPEKVLGVTRDWAEAYPATHRALVAALIEAARWLDLPEHRAEAAQLLIDKNWVQAPADTIRAALQAQPDGLVFHRHAATFPWRSHAIWFALQMLRWRQCWTAPDLYALARDVYRCETYREAAALVAEPCPASDYKMEGGHPSAWTAPGGGLELGPDLLLDGTVFDPDMPLRWLDHQPAAAGMVDRDLLRAANIAPK
ncbi:MAG: ABC transporter substrate-binding protein [Nevskia sp.]|nr:ABC transporter substrate-binding protein [Nevskia sp.]